MNNSLVVFLRECVPIPNKFNLNQGVREQCNHLIHS